MKHFIIILLFLLQNSIFAQSEQHDSLEEYPVDSTIYNENSDEDYDIEQDSFMEAAEVIQSPPLPPYEQKSLDIKKWESLTKDLNYADFEKPKERKKEEKKKNSDFKFPNLPMQFKMLFIFLLLGLLLYIIIRWIIKLRNNPNNVIEKLNLAVEDAEINLPIADLDALIKKAIDENQYNLAIRLYFLKVIQLLDKKNFIVWQRYKTNRSYLQECQQSDFHPSFKEITAKYERYWFGNRLLNQSGFESLQSDFLDFFKKIGYNGK